MNNLRAVLESLKSDKIKERQEGLTAIRTIFAQDHVVAEFHVNQDGRNDPRMWLTVFQALFTTVLTEKIACTKKSASKTTATAERRAAEAASVVRWLTERTVTVMNKRVAKALFEHLTQILAHKNELFTPVALDYIKALRCLVSYTPHLEHLEDDMWVKLVEMGFNVVLGDPVRKSFWDDEMSIVGAEIHEELYDEDEEDEKPMSPSKKRRRGRDESIPPQAPTPKTALRRKRYIVSVSLEQIEFTSLLAILLRSPSAPFLSYRYNEKDNDNHLASAILDRLKRFLALYPTDSSLLHDFLSILLATLSHLALNKRQEVEDFARASWGALVSFWGVKDRRLKEGVVAVLRVLFHFITSEDSSSLNIKSSHDCIDGIWRLWNLLDGEADSRRGVDGLSFDSLRLELCDGQESTDRIEYDAFATKTFRAGWHFDASQALSWAVLELQSDCASKLYHYSESMQTSTSGGLRTQGKRPKLENPISSLLSSIKGSGQAAIRIYHLQTLLFFIERHWYILHKTLRQEVMDTLFQFISYEDGSIQSWVLLCMASVASAEGDHTLCGSSDSPLDVHVCDSIWSHVIRRVNVPLVSRAACHTAHVLLSLTSRSDGPARLPLSSQRILGEIETLAKDIDVQGPLYPYDSVCRFLALCVKVASQDVKLYRMHLEEKILSWLVDNWKLTGIGRGQMPLHQITDVLQLLESICGFNRRGDFVSQSLLPHTLIVHTLVEEEKTRVIRDFLLHAKVPRFKEPVASLNRDTSIGPPDGDLVQPQMRERKISAFFQRSLETINMEWELAKEDYARLTTEMARRSLDLAIVALSFEALLVNNGINSDRRVAQGAAKLVSSVTRALKEAPWTIAEKALVALGLDPLVCIEDESNSVPWQVMLPPNSGTGIKGHILHRLTSYGIKEREQRRAMRIDFLRIIWQFSDVQEELLGEAMATMRTVLRDLIGESSNEIQPHSQRVGDDKDDFEPIRSSSVQRSTESTKHHDDEHYLGHILGICVGFLTVGPSLQSAAGEPTRDKELMAFILSCADSKPEKFLIVFPVVLAKIRHRVLYLNGKTLNTLLDELSKLLQSYAFSRSGRLQRLAVQVLHSTLDIWLTQQNSSDEVADKIRQICDWLSAALRKKKITSWSTRDAFAVFLDEYLERDPGQLTWSITNENEDDEERNERLAELPTALLMIMNSDEDIRVRFRSATVVGRLFSAAKSVGHDPMLIYGDLQKHFTKDLDNFEYMLTRTLALGNIMVVSSEVRRGAYWHTLETCFFVTRYNSHIEAILNGVSQRLGLAKLSQLFDAYASQLAYSICKMNADIHQLPPYLLGYRDRLECAESTFRSFAPSTIVENPNIFENHCAVIQKSVAQGIRECFGDIVGLLIVMWVAEPEYSMDGLNSYLKEHTAMNDDEFNETFHLNVDRITAAVLKCFGDQDVSQGGPIAIALRNFDSTGGSLHTFRYLTRFRNTEDFHVHPPNLPAHPTPVILRALDWIASRSPEAGGKATTYHITLQILADIQISPLVNEQYRLVNALTLWIALHHHDFKDLTLLHSLTHGATSMLAQSDLARAAQSWLEWAFRRYIKERVLDGRLSNILIRIACYANEHAQNIRDASIANIGLNILQWIDNKIKDFDESDGQARRPIFRNQILRALPAWSHQPSPHVIKLSKCIDMETLSSLLNDRHITTNKFRTVRRLRDQAIVEGCNESRFERSDFWRLKECIPLLNGLQIEDADAFAALLFLYKGRINSFGSDRTAADSVRKLHLKCANQDVTTDKEMAVRDSIVLALSSMLDGDEAPKVNLAYQTLRWIMSAIATEAFSLNTWPSEIKDELYLLQKYRWNPRNRPAQEIGELQSNNMFIDSTSNYSRWISMLTILLTDILASSDNFYAQLTPILETNTDFAEQVLPVLVHRLLQSELKAGGHSSRRLLSDYFIRVLALKTANVSCIRAIVDVVLHLRHFSPPKTDDALAYNMWLDVNYSLLAKGALRCGAYTTALLFLELAFEFNNNSSEELSTEEILYEIYSHIDEPDGFYGIHSRDLRRFLIKRFHHEKQWDKALRFHGAALEAGNKDGKEAEGLLESFHAFGFDQLAIDTLRSSSTLGNSIPGASYMNYQLAWRTETWDLPERTEKTGGASLYHAFRSINRERNSNVIDRIVRSSLLDEVSRLRPLGAENLAEIRRVAQDIMCLGEIFRWRLPNIQDRLASKHADVAPWSDFITMPEGFDFENLQSIMAARLSLIRSVRRKEERLQIGNMVTPFVDSLIAIEKQCLVRLSEAARNDGQVQIALNAVVRAQSLEKEASFDVSREFANVLWFQKEEKPATEFLRSLLMDRDHINAIGSGHRASLLTQLGTWVAEAFLEKPVDIRDRYFEPAIELLESSAETCRYKGSVYHQYAVFSDRQYHATIKSPDAIRWKVYVQRKQQEIVRREQELRRAQNTTKVGSMRADQERAKKLLQEDSELFEKHNYARDMFLKQAIEMYSRCLELVDDFDTGAVMRLCSLWFANFDGEAGVHEDIALALERIPSRKMVFLSHQLSARLSKPVTDRLPGNQANLQRLILRMCKEHPFHSLYQVYCLHPDRSTPPTGRRQSDRYSSPQTQTERTAAADDIFNKLKQEEVSANRIRDVEMLCNACVEWAKFPIKDDKRYRSRATPLKVPEGIMLRSITNIKVPVMTCHTPVDPTMRYDNCVWIQRYDTTFSTAGGLNVPKISLCYGSDGQKYKQLFKGEGNDDLRQDAVMEQVFDLVNHTLQRDRETRRRNLNIRGYKVIPLNSQAGLIEFVMNTVPLRGWLHSAHDKYHPEDMKYDEIRQKFAFAQRTWANLRKRPEALEALVAEFGSLTGHFHPVMRHFFTECQRVPISWFTMRLNYTRSVASSSIIGHVLGLGDRHTSNILMDNRTGEVVHIDLGIAFEQGKLLNIPERVPFRLTRDIVDGMGFSGTQGVFQRCAEETLRVLRDNSEVIMTILEVFKYDPLHSWTASEIKLKQVQPETPTLGVPHDASRLGYGISIDLSSGTAEELADRALSSVSRKLDKSLSVQCTVNELIAEATDTSNLATMFQGWGPYL
ncbi:hypothetical protein AX15_003095 [Amanita polypyramis BW_CC]|nr:hypothetical protein AX15_003095 [Amanita polypyramis BW_CC]